MADFQKCLNSRIFGDGFPHLFGIFFLTQTEHFAKVIAFVWAIAFAKRLIFKIVSFLEYLGFFFQVFFCTEQLYCSCRRVFRMFLAFLIFDLK